MRQIRKGIFETNSSSTHSLTMCMYEDYENWRKGNTYFAPYTRIDGKNFFTKKEVINHIKHYSYYKPDVDLNALNDEEFDELVRDCNFYTYDNYGSKYYEYFDDEFTTPSGERVKVFGYYGSEY